MQSNDLSDVIFRLESIRDNLKIVLDMHKEDEVYYDKQTMVCSIAGVQGCIAELNKRN